jgi:uncharacterized protein
MFLTALAAAGTLLVTAGVAAGHVTVTPSSVPAGQDSTLTFRVPDERSDASTTSLRIVLTDGASLRELTVLPKPGWDWTTAPPAEIPPTPAPPTPGMSMPGMSMPGMSSDDSGPAVGSITWTARDSSAAIAPGEFQQFEILAAMPADRTSLVFAALQTYSDGTVVRWIDRAAPGGPQPAHPAPTVTLTAAGSMPGMSMPGMDPTAAPSDKSNAMAGMSMNDGSMAGMDMSGSKSDSVDVALAVGIAALVAAMMAAILAMNALTRARRRGPEPDGH